MAIRLLLTGNIATETAQHAEKQAVFLDVLVLTAPKETKELVAIYHDARRHGSLWHPPIEEGGRLVLPGYSTDNPARRSVTEQIAPWARRHFIDAAWVREAALETIAAWDGVITLGGKLDRVRFSLPWAIESALRFPGNPRIAADGSAHPLGDKAPKQSTLHRALAEGRPALSRPPASTDLRRYDQYRVPRPHYLDGSYSLTVNRSTLWAMSDWIYRLVLKGNWSTGRLAMSRPMMATNTQPGLTGSISTLPMSRGKTPEIGSWTTSGRSGMPPRMWQRRGAYRRFHIDHL